MSNLGKISGPFLGKNLVSQRLVKMYLWVNLGTIYCRNLIAHTTLGHFPKNGPNENENIVPILSYADCIYNLRRWHTWLFKFLTNQNYAEVTKYTGKMRNKLKRMKNQFSDFSDT